MKLILGRIVVNATLRLLAYLAPILLSIVVVGEVFAHQGEPPRFLKAAFEKTAAKDELMLASIDATALRAETRAKRNSDQVVTKTLEYAKADDVSVTPDTHGYWVTVEDGRVWRLRITAPGATDLNLGFTSYFMPKGATLHVYDPASQYFQGPYSAEHNFDHGQLWTPLTPGSQAVVEVFVPTGLEEQLVLQLGRVGKGYQDVFEIGLGALIKQGSCNIDVVCSEGNAWRDEIRSVAVYGTNGSTFCTGTLINNIEQDLTPFFLTADHCQVGASNAASVVTYWNFESPTCGQLSGGSLSQNTSGATFRADDAPNDMTLLELSAQPDPSYNVHYAGWDARASLNPAGSVGIHHPNTDEKAISFNDDSMATTSSCIAASAPTTHWNVDNWEQGTTEPGSSGSALFDPATQRVIGYLSGGSASCSNTGGFDCYGKFSTGWSLGLSTWLDPNNTGATVIDGIDPDDETDPGTPPTGDGEDDILDFMPAIISATLGKTCGFPAIGDSGTISGDISPTDLISTTDKFFVGTNADYYFWQPKGSSRTVTLSSSQIDTFLVIRRGCDPDGPVLFFNDDDGTSLNSRLELGGLSGNYLIEVTTFSTGDFGLYQLSF